MKARKLLALVLALAMALSLCACGNNTGDNTKPDTTPQEEQTPGQSKITVALSSDPKTLCPFGSDGGGRNYTRAIGFEQLTSTNREGEWELCLAKSITNPSEGVYEVELYDYIKDTAGNPLKASDVVFSFQKFIEDGNNAGKVTNLVSYEAIGDYTLKFVFENEKLGNAQELFDKVNIITQAAWEASPDEMVTSPVGTSPYALSSFESGAYYTYEKTNNYWQTDESLIATRSLANVDTVAMQVITDMSTTAIALEKGEIDGTAFLLYADYGTFLNSDGTAKDGFVTDTQVNSVLYHLTFNCGPNSPCSDIYLRQAIATCLDVEAMNTLAFGAGQARTGYGFTNEVWLDTNQAIDDGDYYNYDEAAAKALLEKSSYKGETLKMIVTANDSARQEATMIQAYCAAIGINIELITDDRAVYNENRIDETGTLYDIDFSNERANYYSWACQSELDVNSYKTGVNHCFINDPELQRLYELSSSQATASPENQLEFLQYIEDQCYVYSLATYDLVTFCNDRVTNIVRNLTGDLIPGACTVAD